jgi:DNA repair protein RadC
MASKIIRLSFGNPERLPLNFEQNLYKALGLCQPPVVMIDYLTFLDPTTLDRSQVLSSGGAREFGARHRNWRDLWSNFTPSRPTRITDVELMQSVLCLALPYNDDNEKIAKLLIAKHGDFAKAISASFSDHDYARSFPTLAGVALKVVHAAAERIAQQKVTDQPFLGDRRSIKKYLISTLKHNGTEHARVLFLDASERLLADDILAEGLSPLLRLDPAEVIKRALNWHATAVALVQHTSNSQLPQSLDEFSPTIKIREICERLNIRFLDHFVFRHSKIVSLREQGLV